jgi:hypothetical protein
LKISGTAFVTQRTERTLSKSTRRPVLLTTPFCFGDRRDHHKFYKNNSGKAKVTVTPTAAPNNHRFHFPAAIADQQRIGEVAE